MEDIYIDINCPGNRCPKNGTLTLDDFSYYNDDPYYKSYFVTVLLHLIIIGIVYIIYYKCKTSELENLNTFKKLLKSLTVFNIIIFILYGILITKHYLLTSYNICHYDDTCHIEDGVLISNKIYYLFIGDNKCPEFYQLIDNYIDNRVLMDYFYNPPVPDTLNECNDNPYGCCKINRQCDFAINTNISWGNFHFNNTEVYNNYLKYNRGILEIGMYRDSVGSNCPSMDGIIIDNVIHQYNSSVMDNYMIINIVYYVCMLIIVYISLRNKTEFKQIDPEYP
uniref:Uncharacterized protein n=1 Tax=viral metagenome TaxID=1070528 RepID=A0A6C0F5U8_9ZZZZ|tara:strand:- start:422 stop:1261 length:840 start_codon:yes stop_codon:yes gene_type:complete